MEKDKATRIGSSKEDSKEILAHPFFKDINIDSLLKKEITAPFKPQTDDKLGPGDEGFTKFFNVS